MYPARTRSWWEATGASAGTSLRVGTNDFDILIELPFLLQLPIHRLLELLVRLRAVDEDAVDEEGRRAVHPRLGPRLLVGGHLLLLRAAVEALIELRRIDAHRLRVPLEIVDGESLLVGEHLVVQLPDLALVGRAGARLGRLLCEEAVDNRKET